MTWKKRGEGDRTHSGLDLIQMVQRCSERRGYARVFAGTCGRTRSKVEAPWVSDTNVLRNRPEKGEDIRAAYDTVQDIHAPLQVMGDMHTPSACRDPDLPCVGAKTSVCFPATLACLDEHPPATASQWHEAGVVVACQRMLRVPGAEAIKKSFSF
jgi:hypothetical protein